MLETVVLIAVSMWVGKQLGALLYELSEYRSIRKFNRELERNEIERLRKAVLGKGV